MFKNTPVEQSNIEKAIKFLVTNFEKSGKNPKPVILHSIKTGMKLLDYGYDENIIIAGILHDIIEDTDVEYNDIANAFNKEIADIVRSCSFDRNITDRFERGKELIGRCIAHGKDAVIVKIADRLDTIEFQKNLYKQNRNDDFLNNLIIEHIYFLDRTETMMKHEEIWHEMNDKLNEYFKRKN